MSLFKSNDYSVSKEEVKLAQHNAGLESIKEKNESYSLFVNKAKDYIASLESAIPSQALVDEGQSIFMIGRDILNKVSSIKYSGGVLNSFYTMQSHPGLEDHTSYLRNNISIIKSGLSALIPEVEKLIKS